jgi:hypothetical protein
MENGYNTQTVEVGNTPSVTDATTNGFLHIPLGPGGVSSMLDIGKPDLFLIP